MQGRKRHIAVDVTGLLLTVLTTAAGLQDRDAARPLLRNLKEAFPAVRLVRAGGGYAGKLAWITRCRRTVRDYERLSAHHESIVYWAMIITMTRRLAGAPGPASRQYCRGGGNALAGE